MATMTTEEKAERKGRREARRARGSLLGARIKMARGARHLSQKNLSDLTGIAQPQLSQIELGSTQAPKADKIVEICRALGVSADWLLGLTDEVRLADGQYFAHRPSRIRNYYHSPREG